MASFGFAPVCAALGQFWPICCCSTAALVGGFIVGIALLPGGFGESEEYAEDEELDEAAANEVWPQSGFEMAIDEPFAWE